MSDRNADQLPFAERNPDGSLTVRHADGRIIVHVDRAGHVELVELSSDVDTRGAWLADAFRQFADAVNAARDLKHTHPGAALGAYADEIGVAARDLAAYVGRIESGRDAGAGVHRVSRRS